MAPVLVHSTTGSTASASPFNITIPSTTAGNCVVVVFGINTTTAQTVTIGGGADHMASLLSETTVGHLYTWADPDCAGGQTAVSISNGSGAGVTAVVYEFSGVAASSVLA